MVHRGKTVIQRVGLIHRQRQTCQRREIVFGVGLALLLPRFFGLDGLLYSFPIADALTFIIAAVSSSAAHIAS